MSGCGLDLCYTVPAVEKNCMGAARTSDGVRPPSWRVGIGRSARGSRAARPLASLRSIAPGSAPRAARRLGSACESSCCELNRLVALGSAC